MGFYETRIQDFDFSVIQKFAHGSNIRRCHPHIGEFLSKQNYGVMIYTRASQLGPNSYFFNRSPISIMGAVWLRFNKFLFNLPIFFAVIAYFLATQGAQGVHAGIGMMTSASGNALPSKNS